MTYEGPSQSVRFWAVVSTPSWLDRLRLYYDFDYLGRGQVQQPHP